jgi:hypothetical protein
MEMCLHRRSGGLAYRPTPLNDHWILSPYLSISVTDRMMILNHRAFEYQSGFMSFLMFRSPKTFNDFMYSSKSSVLILPKRLPRDPKQPRPIPKMRCIHSFHVYHEHDEGQPYVRNT